MTPTDPLDDHTGNSLPILVTGAVLVVTACIAGFAYLAEWWLLPVAVLALVAATGIVMFAIGHALGDGDAKPPAAPLGH